MSKDKISIMNGKRIVAAYSTAPFAEATDGYPDYTFFDREVTDQRGKRQTMHWCVRKGRIEIPWGTTFRNGECAANGSLYVSRRKVNEATFYGEGLPFVTKVNVPERAFAAFPCICASACFPISAAWRRSGESRASVPPWKRMRQRNAP